MATQTPNLGLTLPVGSENVSRQVINGNNTLIDTFAGNVNTAMDQMGSNLGILETGDTATHSIAKGEYVTWKGASYTADAAISIGETLAATGGSKNLTACDKGIANALNSNILDLLLTATHADGAQHPTNTLAYPLSNYKEIVVMLLPLGISDRGIVYTIPRSLFVDYGCGALGYGGGNGYLSIKPTSDTNCVIEQGNAALQYTIKVYGKR